MKIIFPIAIVIIIGILGWVAFFKPDAPEVVPGAESTVLAGSEDVGVVGAADERMRAYPLSEVAVHNSAQSCWTVIRGDIYDLTSWVSAHPGGENAILKTCGTDGTSLFEGEHAGDKKQEAKLPEFKIGVLAE